MKQENVKFNVFKVKRKRKDLESIIQTYKDEINILNNQINKSIELLEKLSKESNSN